MLGADETRSQGKSMGILRASSLLLVLSMSLPVAHAAESYDNCTGFIDTIPATIGTQGVWCLRKDLSTSISSGAAITVATNNVTIDCNDFKLGGLSAGAATDASGIRSTGRSNVAVKHCNVRGFRYGAYLDGLGGGHVLEGNRFSDNTDVGVIVEGEGSVVRDNLIFRTGGSTLGNGATGILAKAGVDVIDNTVSGLLPLARENGYGGAVGIFASLNAGGSILGNRVRGLSPVTGSAIGIMLDQSGRMVVRDNDLAGNGYGPPFSVGISCNSDQYQATSRGNVISGFDYPTTYCFSERDTINSD